MSARSQTGTDAEAEATASSQPKAIEDASPPSFPQRDKLLPSPVSPPFTTLTFQDKSLINIRVFSCPPPSSPSAPQCLYYLCHSTWTPSKPHVTLHAGYDTTGTILGIGRIGFASANTIGLGDPADVLGIEWEQLQRTSRWTHSRYEWSLAVGPRAGADDENQEPDAQARISFTWRRTRKSLDDQPDLELFMSAEPARILARYIGHGLWQRVKTKKRGTLEVARGYGLRWERMVLLTAAVIIESSRRRSRAARSG